MDLPQSLYSKCMLVNQIFNQIPLSDNNDSDESKSENSAAIIRNTGNVHYQNGEFEVALMYYSKALALAPLTSSEYSKSLGNRSAALYRLGQYADCLKDIKRALEAGYEDNLKPKLMKRMNSCKEILDRQHGVYDGLKDAREKLFAMSPKLHENILCANVPLYVCSPEPNKREIRAKEDIAPGQLISNEKPFAFHISPAYHTLRCYNCFAKSHVMIPCKHCPSVMFCDEKCREESWESVHKWVCPFINIISLYMIDVDYLALNAVLKARSDKGLWSDFYNSILEADKTFDSMVTRGFVEKEYGKIVFDSNEYCSVYSMGAERSSISSHKMLSMATSASFFVRLLKKYTTFFEDAPEESVNNSTVTVNKYMFLTGGLILHNIILYFSNPMQIAGLTPGIDKKYVDIRFGCGIYPFSSLTTHSCTPNATVVFNNNKAALFAVSPIKKDTKITVSYGSHYTVQSYDIRKQYLQSNLQLLCDCEACANKWPTQNELPLGSFNRFTCSFKSILALVGLGGKTAKFENVITIEYWNRIKGGDWALAIELLPKLCEAIAYLEEYKPCMEYGTYQNFIRFSFALFGNIVSANLELPLKYDDAVLNKYSRI